MRAIRKYFFPLLLSLTIFLSTGISTYAMGDGNIDGGGGSFGTGSELNVWRNKIKDKIIKAWREKIDPKGPPEADEKLERIKGLYRKGKLTEEERKNAVVKLWESVQTAIYCRLIAFHECLLHLLKTSRRST